MTLWKHHCDNCGLLDYLLICWIYGSLGSRKELSNAQIKKITLLALKPRSIQQNYEYKQFKYGLFFLIDLRQVLC